MNVHKVLRKVPGSINVCENYEYYLYGYSCYVWNNIRMKYNTVNSISSEILNVKPTICQLCRSLDKLLVKEEASRCNDGMFDIAPGGHVSRHN